MKHYAKVMLALVGLSVGTLNASAQKVEDFGYFNHLSVGVTAGTAGIGFDVATSVGNYLQLRAGAQFFPNVSYTGAFSPTKIKRLREAIDGLEQLAKAPGSDYIYTPPTKRVDVEAKLGFSSGKVLIDFFPAPKSSNFHITVGCYFGSGDIITLKNTEQGVFRDFLVPAYKGTNQEIQRKFDEIMTAHNIAVDEPLYGIKLGNYQLKPDKNGNLEAGINVNNFRPYVGIGFGRAVPRKRIGFMFELGVQFWGSPKIYIEGGSGRKNLEEQDFLDQDVNDGGLTKILSQINVYPTMTFRLCGRII